MTLVGVVACQPLQSNVGLFDSGDADLGTTAGQATMTAVTSASVDDATSTTAGSGAGSSGGSSSDGGLILDVGPPDGGDGRCVDGEVCLGCTAVDLLFVIDDSVSMNQHQVALGEAFPSFADAIVDTLPPGTSLHVGVTGTTMGYSNSGSTSNCVATGDGDQPAAAFYVTPDVTNTGVNGAQGRLFEAEGQFYFELNTDAGQAEVDALSSWFSAAANIGESGSQIEMSSAGAGWVADPANAATNAGFIRDEGAVLVIFFIQDEGDQTPNTEAMELVDKLAAAKAGCGGMECVVGGGFVDDFCLDQTPLGVLFDNFGSPPVVSELPFGGGDPAVFEPVLVDTLAQVIVQTCEQIPAG
ncbi:MAG: hypothetical protein AAF799_44190 [Myxococcota bacterium]